MALCCQEATQQFSWIIWIFTLLLSETASKKSQTLYMDSTDCDKQFIVSGATVFSHHGIHQGSNYGDDIACRITFQAQNEDWNLSLRVDQFDIPDTSYNHLCNDALYVFDAKRIYIRGFVQAGVVNGVCGTESPAIMLSTGPYITVYFRTDKGGVTGKGFKLVITAYHKDDQHHDCGGEFHCNNDRCIDPGLLCDGVDQCGDTSDESSEEPLQCGIDNSFLGRIFSLGITAAVAITAGTVILVVVIVVCVVCCVCKWSKKRQETAQSAPSPSPAAAESLTNGGPQCPGPEAAYSPVYQQHSYYPLPQQAPAIHQTPLPPIPRTYSPFPQRDSYSQGTGSGFSSSHPPPSYHRSYTPTSSKSGRSHHSGENYVRYHHDQEKVAFPVHV